MEGLPVDVEGGNASGCTHGNLLARVPREVVEHSRFSGASSARDEDVLVRVFNQTKEGLLLGRKLDHGHDSITSTIVPGTVS